VFFPRRSGTPIFGQRWPKHVRGIESFLRVQSRCGTLRSLQFRGPETLPDNRLSRFAFCWYGLGCVVPPSANSFRTSRYARAKQAVLSERALSVSARALQHPRKKNGARFPSKRFSSCSVFPSLSLFTFSPNCQFSDTLANDSTVPAVITAPHCGRYGSGRKPRGHSLCTFKCRGDRRWGAAVYCGILERATSYPLHWRKRTLCETCIPQGRITVRHMGASRHYNCMQSAASACLWWQVLWNDRGPICMPTELRSSSGTQ